MARPGIPALMLFLVAAQASAQQPAVRQLEVVTAFGGLRDDLHAELLQVRRVVRTDDGRFVVANGSPAAVRVFDAEGRFQRELGRGGEGPGEAYRSDWRRYPADPSALPDRMAPNGTLIRILRGTSDSWIVAVVEPATGYYCLFSQGPDGVPGMPSGVLHCGG